MLEGIDSDQKKSMDFDRQNSSPNSETAQTTNNNNNSINNNNNNNNKNNKNDNKTNKKDDNAVLSLEPVNSGMQKMKRVFVGPFGKEKKKYDRTTDVYQGYFRDGWNVLDFVIVASSWAAFFPNSTNYTAIRVLRVLRPLRTITKIAGMCNLLLFFLRCVGSMVSVTFCHTCFIFDSSF